MDAEDDSNTGEEQPIPADGVLNDALAGDQAQPIDETAIEAAQEAPTSDAAPVEGQEPFKVVTSSPDDPGESSEPAALPESVARHQPPAIPVEREFADHLDRAQQGFKDWVRKEIGLLVQNKSHDERVAENP